MLKVKRKEAAKNSRGRTSPAVKGKTRAWRLPSDLSHVRKASEEVLRFFKPLGLNEGVRFDVRLCFEEALINAMKHGNGLKTNVSVLLETGYDDKKLWIKLEDQGRGFDVRGLNDCTKGEGLLKGGGRGIYLVHQLMDEVKYNARGNSILMVKSIQGPQ